MEFLQIKETCLYVKDLDATRQFYAGKLGLEIIGEVENRHVFFRVGTSVLLCFIPEASKKGNHLPGHFGSGNLHVAFEVARDRYEDEKVIIKALGIEIEHEHEWPNNTKSFYFRDPDNHLLEVVMTGMWER
ncbi:VOC family protein [Adhaeribacter soli]|uniref:Glyoxalase n=1 Tax=Adhaeribacter soli TaxID=2607655 RepID=A0A5N1J1K9_9BACT|nr:VOC family protein [Adhaeribacter soli]KAA9340628.1 glyoxalase [Adhaeribacter soli]